MSGAFLFAEIASLGLFLLVTLDTWRLRYKPSPGLKVDVPYSVDVFILVSGEPFHIVSQTLKGAKAIRWKHRLSLFVLDDGNSVQVRSLAKQLGFYYLSRPAQGIPIKNAKAGNLNFGLQNSDGDLILTLDADQFPEPEILEVMSGYMKFPELAFVQSKQNYIVPLGDPFFNRDEIFYGTVQQAFDNINSVISCGSGVLYRRAALEDIGGFKEWNIVEDLTTSYELHAKGWKSFYYGHPVTTGLAPASIRGVYQQRRQWALDTIRIMFYDNPLLKKGLSWRKRLGYMTVGLSYLWFAFIIPFFFIMPIWTYLTGNFILSESFLEFVFVRLIYFIFMVIGMHYIFQTKKIQKQFQMQAGIFPAYIIAFFQAFRYPPGKKPQYRPNIPRQINTKPTQSLLILPQLILFMANALLPFYSALANIAPAKVIFANTFISAFAMWNLWHILAASIAKKTWKPLENPEENYDL